MNIEALNAVTRDRARIREAIMQIPLSVNIPGAECIRRGAVLEALTDNIVQPYKVPVHCACCPGSAEHKVGADLAEGKDETTISWHAHPAHAPIFVPRGIEPILRNKSIGYTPEN